ncbi:hypothetical protein ATE84_3702 [Aquimarina sp. MAR_2010_214]|uniref:hypothetical protein n=1 Tax=Aquimarina sp. MAR_2010_214 TaxID=1250026 RepID=UPI000CB477F1|nr:hypothetical protein [Aquimarina sp. MAR_2010_214]PKV51612.1 hypothetical protein ATE84_3702 [Aquimarina sp. MAR_2010_214]
MKNKKKLSFIKMNVTQLNAIKGGNIMNPFRTIGKNGPSEQPVGGGGACYSDAPMSCMVCV